MNKEEYELVVKTDCWKLRREAYLKKNTWCEVCGNPKPGMSLEVHHLTYDRIGNELDSDLVATCCLCHRLLHGLGILHEDSFALVLGNLQHQLKSPKREILIAKVLERKSEMDGGAATS
jgi:hypothetical protein